MQSQDKETVPVAAPLIIKDLSKRDYFALEIYKTMLEDIFKHRTFDENTPYLFELAVKHQIYTGAMRDSITLADIFVEELNKNQNGN